MEKCTEKKASGADTSYEPNDTDEEYEGGASRYVEDLETLEVIPTSGEYIRTLHPMTMRTSKYARVSGRTTSSTTTDNKQTHLLREEEVMYNVQQEEKKRKRRIQVAEADRRYRARIKEKAGKYSVRKEQVMRTLHYRISVCYEKSMSQLAQFVQHIQGEKNLNKWAG